MHPSVSPATGGPRLELPPNLRSETAPTAASLSQEGVCGLKDLRQENQNAERRAFIPGAGVNKQAHCRDQPAWLSRRGNALLTVSPKTRFRYRSVEQYKWYLALAAGRC